MHFESLRAYFRLGELPPELSMAHQQVFDAEVWTFKDEVPESWLDIYGESLGTDLVLPSLEKPIVIEDDMSAVMLWNADPSTTGVQGTIGYLQAQRTNSDVQAFLSFSDPAVLEELRETISQWKNSLKIDWGLMQKLVHDPSRGPGGYLASICPLLTCVVDPEIGTRASEHRNSELLNDICQSLPDWKPYPEAQRPYFDEPYALEIQRAVVHAVHQYALMKN